MQVAGNQSAEGFVSWRRDGGRIIEWEIDTIEVFDGLVFCVTRGRRSHNCQSWSGVRSVSTHGAGGGPLRHRRGLIRAYSVDLINHEH